MRIKGERLALETIMLREFFHSKTSDALHIGGLYQNKKLCHLPKQYYLVKKGRRSMGVAISISRPPS